MSCGLHILGGLLDPRTRFNISNINRTILSCVAKPRNPLHHCSRQHWSSLFNIPSAYQKWNGSIDIFLINLFCFYLIHSLQLWHVSLSIHESNVLRIIDRLYWFYVFLLTGFLPNWMFPYCNLSSKEIKLINRFV